MKHADKIQYMKDWCSRHGSTLNLYGCTLTLDGECGFGRECVGVLVGEIYPDYEVWDYESDEIKRLDNNGDVWRPKNAYHKHPCVAVLGHGKKI